ncbi:S8 family serine peptidase [Flavobacterium silvaticum]|uniref:S8 family serine peptidase n=1 Tax=Flavobacterium silvaticum TaxID=1852020 RepID=A0A972FLF7_9FLAO|nr:S8 family serine peptidase [Flavobacterium silvaticum]NMH27888.1 S8 family serine peptidase [Flavobacterium silvaticum]
MKIKPLFFLLLLFQFSGYSQQDAWVYFSDKPDVDFYFANPLQMLSQRSLDRRSVQNIPLDEKDVPVHPEYVTGLTQSPGITVMAVSKWLNAAHVRGEVADISALASLTYVSAVDFADNSLDASNRVRPQIPHSQRTQQVQQTQADFPYGGSANQIQMLNGQLLHQQDFTGSGMQIAVIDAGFPGVDSAAPFQRLHDNNLILGGYNFVNNSTDFYVGGNHGTYVLSTLGGYAENQLVGTAPDASYYLLVSEDVSSENPVEESYWAEAAEMADSLGVDVITTSLGYRPFDNPAYSYTYADMDGQTTFISRAAEIAFTRGMIVVVSAGNSGGSDDPHIWAPSDAEHVLSIGAVDATENYAGFSSTGPSADGRIKPDMAAQGQASTVSGTDGTIFTLNGTSFAAPILAGMITCFWQAAPDKTNQEIVDLVKQSCDQFASPDYLKGYGIPDFGQALALSVNQILASRIHPYPNPVSTSFYFDLPANASGHLKLYNNLGQLVFEKEVSNNPIDVSGLSSAMYFYQLQTSDQRINGKLIKQ